MSLARQRAENDLADLERTRRERMESLERLKLARHGSVRHLAKALVLLPGAEIAVFYTSKGGMLTPRCCSNLPRKSPATCGNSLITFLACLESFRRL